VITWHLLVLAPDHPVRSTDYKHDAGRVADAQLLYLHVRGMSA
jgi:hypothetical protein